MTRKAANYDQFQIRLPDGMRDRIRWYAERNGRSMNAEIVATLDEKYPPPGIDVEVLASFLAGFSELAPEEREEFLALVNATMAGSPTPYTLKVSGDGVVYFYPYATKSSDGEANEE